MTYITAETASEAVTIGRLAAKIPGAQIYETNEGHELQCDTVKLIKVAAGETP